MKPQLLKPIRVFFAFDLDEKTRLIFQKMIATLKNLPHGKSLRWSNPKNLHMTLRFIGHISPAQTPVLAQHLRKTLRSIPPFKIQFDKIMPFPSKMKPQVLAVDVQYSHMLQNLFQLVEKSVVEFGLPQEKKIQRPHITLARFKEGFIPDIDVSLANLNITAFVDNITLFQSVSSEKGIRYEILEKIMLTT